LHLGIPFYPRQINFPVSVWDHNRTTDAGVAPICDAAFATFITVYDLETMMLISMDFNE